MNSKYIRLLIFMQLNLLVDKHLFLIGLGHFVKTLVYEYQYDKLQNHILPGH